MADTGWVAPTDEGQIDSEWVSETNVYLDNSSYANALNAAGFKSQDYHDFDFSVIPDGATIDGLEVKVEAKNRNASEDMTLSVQLVRERLGLPGKAGDVNQDTWTTSTETAKTFGGATDKWGLPLTPAMVKSSSFGVWFTTTFATGFIFDFDYIRIKVYYHSDYSAEGTETNVATDTVSASIGTTGAEETTSTDTTKQDISSVGEETSTSTERGSEEKFSPAIAIPPGSEKEISPTGPQEKSIAKTFDTEEKEA